MLKICHRVLGCLAVVLLAGMAQAAETTPTDSSSGQYFASVWKLRGSVSAQGANTSTSRQLREGDMVFVGETIAAGSAGEAVLKTLDAGVVAVRPGAEFVVDRYSAKGNTSDSQVLRILTGSLRLITGWIGRTNRAGHVITTPNATIGIRGTDHEPFVLTDAMAKDTENKPGTYDKVNRGGTALDMKGKVLDIDAGKVGFARQLPRTRALMTLLMPVILEKVPNFYVPGVFDEELDKVSLTADADALQQLQQLQKKPVAECVPKIIASAWLEQLDRGLAQRNAQAVVALFAADVAVRADVAEQDGSRTVLDFSRDEFVQSTLTALDGLANYTQRRISIDATKPENAEAATACSRVAVKSVVIEQGLQSGKPFRFESLEEYQLELRDGNWLAIKAVTTQR